jgi:ribosomal protein L40E
MTQSTARRHPNAASAPLTPQQTEEWLRTYRRHSRIYAWGFFAVILPVILGVIWWEMGEINEDVLYSFGFAAVVTFFLALWARKGAEKSWSGVVEDLFMKKVRRRRDGGLPDEVVLRPRARIRTDRGKTITVPVTEDLFDYFELGDRVFKIAGLEWPEKVSLDRQKRVCMACGGLYTLGAGNCPRCGAPEPDHATLVRLAAAS